MLTDLQCRKAKPDAKPFKLPDSHGLHLYVTPAGGKHWRYRYELGGKEKTLTIGPYPAVSLTGARTARDLAKTALRDGRDPSLAKRLQRVTLQAELLWLRGGRHDLVWKPSDGVSHRFFKGPWIIGQIYVM